MKKVLWGIAILLSACATMSSSMHDVSIGMTEQEVESKLGRPVSKSANGTVEYMNYSMYESTWDPRPTKYFVRLIDGKVQAYGRLGDFNSTKDPTVNVNINQK
jgi:hypothetical protein